MKKIVLFSLLVFIFLAAPWNTSIVNAHGIEIYGYSDFLFSYGKYNDETRSTFAQNRTNILFSSELFRKWDFFLNLEVTGEFQLQSIPGFGNQPDSTSTKGGIELEEAWTSYTVSEKLKIKAGIFHSPFGSFNAIQEASPSYISVRPPMIYDDDFRSKSPIHIIPDRSNIELSGKFRFKKTLLEYHLYLGNGLGADARGQDINLSKSIGSRLAFNYDENLKLGFSIYYDNAYIEGLGVHPAGDDSSSGHPGGTEPGIGYMSANEKRLLWSVDFYYSLSKFNINGEFFRNHNKNDMGRKFIRQFYYVNLNYEFIDKVRAYWELDNYRDCNFMDSMHLFLNKGQFKTLYGLNYKPNWRTAIKAEIQHYYFKEGLKDSYTVFVSSLSVIF